MTTIAEANGAVVHCCDWRELPVAECDAVIVDAPYSARTHAGHDAGAESKPGDGFRSLNYSAWTPADVREFVSAWSPRCKGWFVSITDHVLARAWEAELEAAGRYVFAPVPFCAPRGPRVAGDGPAAWATWIIVARPREKRFLGWGSLPGYYHLPAGFGGAMPIMGGKPLWLMTRLVEDYSRPGDLIVDPCCGAGTLAAAALRVGRRAVAGDANRAHAELAAQWIANPWRVAPSAVAIAEPALRCGGCRVLYRFGAFSRDRTAAPDRQRQSWCHLCHFNRKQEPETAWEELVTRLGRDEPGSFAPPRGWTKEEFLRRWKDCGGNCTLCGTGLRKWQVGGHNLDRVGQGDHAPDNSRFVCWPCNLYKRDNTALEADHYLRSLGVRFPNGTTPWDEIQNGRNFKLNKAPSVAEFIVSEEDQQCDLFGGTK